VIPGIPGMAVSNAARAVKTAIVILMALIFTAQKVVLIIRFRRIEKAVNNAATRDDCYNIVLYMSMAYTV